MVEKRETRGGTDLRAGRATMGEERESLETEAMRDCKVRGDWWVSRLNAEPEADMIEEYQEAIEGGGGGGGRRGWEEAEVGERREERRLEMEMREEKKKAKKGEKRVTSSGPRPLVTRAGRLLPVVRSAPHRLLLTLPTTPISDDSVPSDRQHGACLLGPTKLDLETDGMVILRRVLGTEYSW